MSAQGTNVPKPATGFHIHHPEGHAVHQSMQLPWGEMCCVRRGTVPCVPEVCWNLSINLMGFGLGPEFSAVPAKWTPQAGSPLVLE